MKIIQQVLAVQGGAPRDLYVAEPLSRVFAGLAYFVVTCVVVYALWVCVCGMIGEIEYRIRGEESPQSLCQRPCWGAWFQFGIGVGAIALVAFVLFAAEQFFNSFTG